MFSKSSLQKKKGQPFVTSQHEHNSEREPVKLAQKYSSSRKQRFRHRTKNVMPAMLSDQMKSTTQPEWESKKGVILKTRVKEVNLIFREPISNTTNTWLEQALLSRRPARIILVNERIVIAMSIGLRVTTASTAEVGRLTSPQLN